MPLWLVDVENADANDDASESRLDNALLTRG